MIDQRKLSGIHILNTECARFSPLALNKLANLGRVINVDADRNFLMHNIENFEILFIGLKNLIDENLLLRAKNLKCIVTPTTGTNHIDCKRAKALGVDILSLYGETEFLKTISATAELTWGLLLNLVRKINDAHLNVLNGKWIRDNFCGNELTGKTLGIVGYGRLGRIVAQYGKAFGMSLLAFDQEEQNDSFIRFVSLEELLKKSDVISIHLPLNDSTCKMFNSSLFSNIKPGALFINTSRGEIINEIDLLKALDDKILAGVALDVLSNETSLDQDWLSKSPIVSYAKKHTNVLLTPHIGGLTYESVDKTNDYMIQKLKSYIKRMNLS
jgi:D-3-phosphoglycerate dehydrogenase